MSTLLRCAKSTKDAIRLKATVRVRSLALDLMARLASMEAGTRSPAKGPNGDLKSSLEKALEKGDCLYLFHIVVFCLLLQVQLFSYVNQESKVQ